MLDCVMIVIEAPEPLVSLEEAKAWLRLEHDDDDELISGLISTISKSIDGPGGWLGSALGRQVLEQRMSRSNGNIELEYGPADSVLWIRYDDVAGVEQTLPAEVYSLTGDSVVLKPGMTWPGVRRSPASVRVRYVAGYAEADVPDNAKQAVLMKVARLYNQRGEPIGSSVRDDSAGDDLLEPFRDWAFF